MGLIVGLDPGLYTAVVLLDLSGRVVAHAVRRDWGEKEVVEFIMSHGRPLLFATDVAHVPSFVEKVAARFHAPIFVPKRDLSKAEKASLSPYRDDHLRDAHAAALKAYRHYQNRFRSVERRAPTKEEAERAKEAILQGRTAFSLSAEEEQDSKKERRESPPRKEVVGKRVKRPEREERLEVLRRSVAYYRQKCEKLEQELAELRKRNRELKGRVKRLIGLLKHKGAVRKGKKAR